MKVLYDHTALVAALLVTGGVAQSSIGTAKCSSTISASYAAPSVADGYVARLVAKGLTKPRGIKFDSEGNLLVVEQLTGITALTLEDAGNGCISVASQKNVITDDSLNHGIEISDDGKTLYASSPESVYSWDYSASDQTNTSEPQVLVTNMTTSDHTTRTLLLSSKSPGMLLVTRGSTSNIDPEAADISTGHSQIKAFDISSQTGPYDFNNDGVLVGWGLRNDVGIDEEPMNGGIYTVENSADEITRNGQDIHQDNPAEEMNYFGSLDDQEANNFGRNFGYPICFTAWKPSDIPGFSGSVGEQFAIGDVSSTNNDTTCNADHFQPPRLSFQAHMAPLDILFNTEGTAAWVTFHGSWDRSAPVGYKLSVVEFADGEPVEPSDSTTAAVDIVSNQDNSKCPSDCFRPVGLAWDSQGRLFMSSDATGEIYAILRADGSATSTVGSNSTSTISSSGGSGTSSSAAASSSMSVADKKSTSALAVIFGALVLWI